MSTAPPTRRPTAPPRSWARCSRRRRPPRRSSTTRPPGSWTARSPSQAAPATSTAARSPAPTATSKPAPSCTHSAPTAPTNTSPTSPSAKRHPSTKDGRSQPQPTPRPTRDARAFRDALGQVRDRRRLRHGGAGRRTRRTNRELARVGLARAPLVSFSPARSSLTWSRMRRAGRFGVNVLGRHHERFAVRATPPEQTDSPTSTGNSDSAAYRCSPTPSPPSNARSSPSIPPAITGSS